MKTMSLTASHVEGTIVQKNVELGLAADFEGHAFVGADEDYASLLA